MTVVVVYVVCFFFSSRRRHTRCALVTGVQTCALPIWNALGGRQAAGRERRYGFHRDEQPVVTDFGDRLDAPAQYDATQCIGPLRPADIDSKRTIAGDNVAIAALAQLGRASCRARVCQYV